MKTKKSAEILKLILRKALAIGGPAPETRHLALAMLHTPETRKLIANVYMEEEDELHLPLLPQLDCDLPALPAKYPWPADLTDLFSLADDAERVTIRTEDLLADNESNAFDVRIPEDEKDLYRLLRSRFPKKAWLRRNRNFIGESAVQLENFSRALSAELTYLGGFVDELGRALGNQMQWRKVGFFEPVFFYSTRPDDSFLNDVALGLTGQEALIIDEDSDDFEELPKRIRYIKPGRLILLRFSNFGHNKGVREKLHEAMRKELPDQMKDKEFFMQHLDGTVVNLLCEHWVLFQVMVGNEMEGYMDYPVDKFKTTYFAKLDEDEENLLFGSNIEVDQAKRFLKISNASNSFLQPRPSLPMYFRTYISLCLQAFRELTESSVLNKLTDDDIVHLAAQTFLSNPQVITKPSVHVLVFRQRVEEMISKFHSVEETHRVVVKSNNTQHVADEFHGDRLIAHYAALFLLLVREERSLITSLETDAGTASLVIRYIEPEREKMPVTGENTGNHWLEHVAGMKEVKELFGQLIHALRHPERYEALNVRPFFNILLYGPTGSGKTYVAKALGNQANITFHYISAAKLNGQRYAGFGAAMLRDFLETAAQTAPCIVFIDELDAFTNRETNQTGSVAYDARSILNTLLTFMDGLDTNRNIIFMAATNRIQDLDAALLRDGRFGTRIKVKHLDRNARKDLIGLYLSPEMVEGDYENVLETINNNLAPDTPNASVKTIIENMKRRAIADDRSKVTLADVEAAIDEFEMGMKVDDLAPELRKPLAFRMAAKGVAINLLMPEQRLERITIVNRQNAFGRIVSAPFAEKEYVLAKELFCMMVITYCSLLAERRKLGLNILPVKPETEVLVSLAKNMLQHYDLGEGELTALHQALSGFSDPETDSRLHAKLTGLIGMAREAASNLLSEYWAEVEIVAGVLQRDGVANKQTLGIIPNEKLDPFSLISDPGLTF